MIFETVAIVISLTAAGSACVLCHGAKRYFEKSVGAFRLSILMANKAEHSYQIAAQYEAKAASASSNALGYAANAAAAKNKTLEIHKDVAELAASHAELSRAHVANASLAADRASVHADNAGTHADTAGAHAETANTAARTAGTLSVAVTEAAQRAASKSQTQAECYACHRAVNSYTLRSDGRIVCKWCSDRGK